MDLFDGHLHASLTHVRFADLGERVPRGDLVARGRGRALTMESENKNIAFSSFEA